MMRSRAALERLTASWVFIPALSRYATAVGLCPPVESDVAVGHAFGVVGRVVGAVVVPAAEQDAVLDVSSAATCPGLFEVVGLTPRRGGGASDGAARLVTHPHRDPLLGAEEPLRPAQVQRLALAVEDQREDLVDPALDVALTHPDRDATVEHLHHRHGVDLTAVDAADGHRAHRGGGAVGAPRAGAGGVTFGSDTGPSPVTGDVSKIIRDGSMSIQVARNDFSKGFCTGCYVPRTGQGPAWTTVDLRAEKDVAISRYSVGVTLEAFNLFNEKRYQNFQDFNPPEGNPHLGEPTAIVGGSQRRFQIGLRFRY